MFTQKKTTLVFLGLMRTLQTSSSLNANHYEVLEITPKATQGDIKSAYYKLSKIYHPDKSTDEASAKKFRAITEAYEVLGNIKLKKIYDRGMLVGREDKSTMHYQPEPEPTDPTLKFYKSRAQRHVVPTMDGRTPIYDFDAWSRNHYGDLFKTSQYEKEFRRKKRQKEEEIAKAGNQEALLYFLCAVGGLFVVLAVHGKDDYDQIRTQTKVAQPDESEKGTNIETEKLATLTILQTNNNKK